MKSFSGPDSEISLKAKELSFQEIGLDEAVALVGDSAFSSFVNEDKKIEDGQEEINVNNMNEKKQSLDIAPTEKLAGKSHQEQLSEVFSKKINN